MSLNKNYSLHEDVVRGLATRFGYEVSVQNGQRILVSYKTTDPPRAKGTEVFLGNLPHDLFEDELLPVFLTIAPVYKMRLMLDFFGRNRGYGFVQYFRPEDSDRAVRFLNGFFIRQRTKIAISLSVDNRRLFIGNIPRERTAEDVKMALEKYVSGVVEIIVYNQPYNRRLNRGFVFVEFESHRLAAIARRHLAPGNLSLWGQNLFVDWAEPIPIVPPDVLKSVTKLYLNNLPISLSNTELKANIIQFVNPSSILRVHKVTNYAFVHLSSRKYAEIALINLKGLTIKGNIINVDWARPIEYNKIHRMENVPNHYCRSVPPTMRKLVQQSVQQRKMARNVNSYKPTQFHL